MSATLHTLRPARPTLRLGIALPLSLLASCALWAVLILGACALFRSF